MSIIYWIVIGLVAGFVASQIMKSKSDLITNLIVGVVGSVIGGFLAGQLGIAAGGLIGSLVIATVGAVVLIWALRIIKSR